MSAASGDAAFEDSEGVHHFTSMGSCPAVKAGAAWWIVGTYPDEVVEQNAQYPDWDFDHLVFHAPGGDQEQLLDPFERDLAPRLRALDARRKETP